jgi:hypothetical protein
VREGLKIQYYKTYQVGQASAGFQLCFGGASVVIQLKETNIQVSKVEHSKLHKRKQWRRILKLNCKFNID